MRLWANLTSSRSGFRNGVKHMVAGQNGGATAVKRGAQEELASGGRSGAVLADSNAAIV